jgi:hypothetical protein
MYDVRALSFIWKTVLSDEHAPFISAQDLRLKQNDGDRVFYPSAWVVRPAAVGKTAPNFATEKDVERTF